MGTVEAVASISDSAGNLLFYSNGQRVWNRLHEVMPNGDSIIGFPLLTPAYAAWIDSFGNSSSNGVVIVPMPGSTHSYYLFSVCNDVFDFSLNNALLYSVIDINADGGLGDMILKNVFLDSVQRKFDENVAACRHGNGRDWWIVTHEADTNNFVVWLVTPFGVNGPWIQSVGSKSAYSGEMCFNPAGDRIGLNVGYGLEVLDFDRCSGLFSNPVTLRPVEYVSPWQMGFYGCAFSPNGLVFYAASWDSLLAFEFDTNGDLQNESLIWINPFHNDYFNVDSSHTIGQLQLGFDGRIYFGLPFTWQIPFTEDGYTDYLFAVVNANNISVAYVQDSAIYLGTAAWLSLPNSPNYNLVALSESSCDTLQTIVNAGNLINAIRVYPNPAYDALQIESSLPVESKVITDAVGKQVSFTPSRLNLIDISGLTPGIYIVSHHQVESLPAAVCQDVIALVELNQHPVDKIS